MARYLYKTINLSEFSSLHPYQLRFRLEDEALFASVGRCGVLQPIVINKEREIVSGHKRYAAAKSFGIAEVEVMEVNKDLSPQETFFLAVLSNWAQPFSEFDKAHAVFQASAKFHFSESQINEEILPALGLEPGKGFYEEAREIFSLSPQLIEMIRTEKIPFRGSRILSSFNLPDQGVFANLAAEVVFTTNQLLKAGEWLQDLLKLRHLTLEKLLREGPLSAVLSGKQDRKNKGEHFFLKLRQLRFPNVAEREKQFLGFADQFKDEKLGVSVEMPPHFEGEGLTLKAKLKDAQSLDRVLEVLQSKRKVLNSLLDIVL